MEMHHKDGVFWVDSTREEYLTPKAAGFLWHPTLGCLGACVACPLGLAKKWWTKIPTNALKLIKFADAAAAAALETHKVGVSASRAAEVMDIEDFARRVPSPEGLDYLPYQKAGIQYALERKSTLIGDEMGLGKGLCYGTPMLTPTGFVKVEDVHVGDELCDPDGGVARVTGVFPQPAQPVYRVTFSDGASVTVDGPHRWLVLTANDRFRGDAGRVMTTTEIAEAGLRTKKDKRGQSNRVWFIPVTEPVTFHPLTDPKPLHPYVLGALLGDGSFRHGVSISCPDVEVLDRVRQFNSLGEDKKQPEGKCPTYTVLQTTEAIRTLKLFGHYSTGKWVPRQYLRDSIDNRIELLHGLMDTDGDCTEDGTAIFSTSSEVLAYNMVDLTRSLGGIATVSKKAEPHYTYKGEDRIGSPAYRVNVRTPMNPFRLERKAARWHKPNLTRGIEAIEPAGEAETICISVDSKRNLFITDHYIVTHNTIQALGFINAMPKARRVLIVCPPSLRINWSREAEKWLTEKWIIHVIHTDDDLFKMGETQYVAPTRQLFITSYNKFGGKRNAKLQARIMETDWALIIADEAHYVKNPKAQRTQGLLGKYTGKGALEVEGVVHRAARLLFLTGTPITNRPVELFPLLQALDPMDIGASFTRYAFKYCDAHQVNIGRGRLRWDFTGASNLGELQDRLRSRVMVRRLKVDVLKELPPKRRQVVELAANGAEGVVKRQAEKFLAQEAKLDELELAMDMAEELDDEEVFREAATALQSARQIAFEEMSGERKKVAMAKVPYVVEHVQEMLAATDSKILVFAHHKDVIAKIREDLGVETLEITGKTSMQQRQANVDRFQSDPELRVLVCNIIAAGVGWTLTAADKVVFAELDWVPANMLQAEDRTHRIGQVNPVLCQYLVFDGSVDAKMSKALISKMEVIEKALDKEHEVGEIELQLAPRKRFDRRYPVATPEVRAAAAAVVKQLAAVCDGAVERDGMGFNGLDARFGHEVARRAKVRELTDGEVQAIKKMTQKYRRQLDAEQVGTLWAADAVLGMDFIPL